MPLSMNKKLVVKGHIKGLKKGTLYLQKMNDTALVSIDSMSVYGDGNFTLTDNVDSPVMYYLTFDGNATDKRILFFGNQGTISENIRDEQRKIIKYNQLVANMTILHNVEAMTGVLKQLQNEGHLIDEEILAGLAPYRTEHINRYGDYILNLEQKIRPLNYKVKIEKKA